MNIGRINKQTIQNKNFNYLFVFALTNKYTCQKCGSKKLILVLKLPWSTDGLMPKQQIFLKCEDCGYEIPIKGE